MEEEHGLLKKNYDSKIFDVFQKSGFLNLVLEKELKMLTEKLLQKDL